MSVYLVVDVMDYLARGLIVLGLSLLLILVVVALTSHR